MSTKSKEDEMFNEIIQLFRDRSPPKLLVVPSDSKTSHISKILKGAGLNFLETARKKVGDMIKNRNKEKRAKTALSTKYPAVAVQNHICEKHT